MLKEILCISGKPGLYKLLSYGKKMVIVESLVDKKRTAAHGQDKLISLGDVAIYTTEDDIPLGQVFETIYKKYGKTIDAKECKTPEQLKAFFTEILPTYDPDRVYNSDIKKVISWFNILVNAGFTTFVKEEEEATTEETPTEETKENK